MAINDRICVGQIGAAHGLRGEVRIKPFTQAPESLARFAPLTDESGERAFKIVRARPSKGVLVATLEGVSSREAAEGLRGVRLFVGRDQLPQTDEDEFYHADLIGLSAFDGVGAELGTVTALYDHGAGDMIEITPRRGEALLLPFTLEVVPRIDIANSRVEVRPPAEVVAEQGHDPESQA